MWLCIYKLLSYVCELYVNFTTVTSKLWDIYIYIYIHSPSGLLSLLFKYMLIFSWRGERVQHILQGQVVTKIRIGIYTPF